MSERGFTVLEVLVAGAVLAFLLFGLGSFYVSTVRSANQGTGLVGLQRQASLAFDEMARQITPASLLEYPVTCGGDVNALRATNSCGTFCFHRDTATLSQLLEDRALTDPVPAGCQNATSGAGTMDLLKDALMPDRGASALLSTVDTVCSATSGGFCPSLVRHNGTNCVVGATITLRLRDQLPESLSFQVMTFATTINGRALPIPVPPATTCP